MWPGLAQAAGSQQQLTEETAPAIATGAASSTELQMGVDEDGARPMDINSSAESSEPTDSSGGEAALPATSATPPEAEAGAADFAPPAPTLVNVKLEHQEVLQTSRHPRPAMTNRDVKQTLGKVKLEVGTKKEEGAEVLSPATIQPRRPTAIRTPPTITQPRAAHATPPPVKQVTPFQRMVARLDAEPDDVDDLQLVHAVPDEPETALVPVKLDCRPKVNKRPRSSVVARQEVIEKLGFGFPYFFNLHPGGFQRHNCRGWYHFLDAFCSDTEEMTFQCLKCGPLWLTVAPAREAFFAPQLAMPVDGPAPLLDKEDVGAHIYTTCMQYHYDSLRIIRVATYSEVCRKISSTFARTTAIQSILKRHLRIPINMNSCTPAHIHSRPLYTRV